MRQRSEPCRIALAGDQRIQHRPPALAQHIGKHRVELDIGVLQRLVDALRVARLLAHQLFAGAQQRAQLLRLPIRDKTRPDQTMRQQFREPGGIVHVGLAPWHVLHMRGIRQNEFDLAIFEHMPDRLPVHARRLHGHVRAAVLGKPVRQGQKTLRGRRKRLHFRDDLAIDGEPHRRHHRLLVDIQSGASLIQKLHRVLPPRRRRPGTSSKNSHKRAPRPKGPIGDSRGCSKVPRSNSGSG